MGSNQLLADAVSLMVLGMGTVFVFLTLLVYLTSLMSVAVNRLIPAPTAVPQPPNPASASTAADDSLPVVISAAIHAHRSRH